MTASRPGVIIFDKVAGECQKREGSIVYEDEELLGGWAKSLSQGPHPPQLRGSEADRIRHRQISVEGQKATMIRKVALVHALREAFPSTFGSLYDESEVHVDAESTAVELDEAGQASAPPLDPHQGSC